MHEREIGIIFSIAVDEGLQKTRNIAEDYRHPYIGIEHVLLAFYPQFAPHLASYNVTQDQIASGIVTKIGKGKDVCLNPRPNKRVVDTFDIAGEQAFRGNGTITPDLLLYAICSDDSGVAVDILKELGCDLEALKVAALNAYQAEVRSANPLLIVQDRLHAFLQNDDVDREAREQFAKGIITLLDQAEQRFRKEN